MSIQVLSRELSEIMEKSEIDYMVDRMKAMQERPGNPMGVEIRQFGGATAFHSKEMPWPQFNTVKGMSINEIEYLDDILELYQNLNSRLQFEVIPSKANKELMQALYDRNFYQSDFHATCYGQPQNIIRSSNDIVVVRELKEDEMDLYAEIHCLGTGLPVSGKGHVADNNIVLYRREGWKFYIGLINGNPAGVSVMFMKDGLASLTFATTLPEYRNQGAQSALLERRISDAHHNNCSLVISQAAYASTSHRNMERAGMKLGYTRGTWVRE